MKRLLVILLLLVHTVANSGMVLSAHYCMGSIASVSISHNESKKCDNCGMEDKGCCHDDQKIIKLDDSHLIQTASLHFKMEMPFIAHQHFTVFDVQKKSQFSFRNTSFEKYNTPPIYLRDCNFRI